MITCTLNGKVYSVDFVPGRALREMEEASKMYARINRLARAAANGDEVDTENEPSVAEAMDTLVKWFCLLFRNQFTPDELYDGYPADRIMVDIPFALMAVQTQTTAVLKDFPMKPVGTTDKS